MIYLISNPTYRRLVILLGRLHAMYEGSRSVLYAAGIPFLLVTLTAAAELVLYALGVHGKAVLSSFDIC